MHSINKCNESFARGRRHEVVGMPPTNAPSAMGNRQITIEDGRAFDGREDLDFAVRCEDGYLTVTDEFSGLYVVLPREYPMPDDEDDLEDPDRDAQAAAHLSRLLDDLREVVDGYSDHLSAGIRDRGEMLHVRGRRLASLAMRYPMAAVSMVDELIRSREHAVIDESVPYAFKRLGQLPLASANKLITSVDTHQGALPEAIQQHPPSRDYAMAFLRAERQDLYQSYLGIHGNHLMDTHAMDIVFDGDAGNLLERSLRYIGPSDLLPALAQISRNYFDLCSEAPQDLLRATSRLTPRDLGLLARAYDAIQHQPHWMQDLSRRLIARAQIRSQPVPTLTMAAP